MGRALNSTEGNYCSSCGVTTNDRHTCKEYKSNLYIWNRGSNGVARTMICLSCLSIGTKKHTCSNPCISKSDASTRNIKWCKHVQ